MSTDPFPHLPPRRLFATNEAEPVAAATSGALPPAAKHGSIISKREVAVEALAVGEKRGRGRPRSTTPKPWEVAGISRALWYRRKEKGEAK
jgi:hypothetical protein